MIIANKDEMFKRAYTGLQNTYGRNKSGAICNLNAIEFSYTKDRKTLTAILFVISPSIYYIFAFDDGLIIEYIDNKINVLDFKHINKEYDVNLNQDIMATISLIGSSAIDHPTVYFAQTFFKKKLNKTHSKYLTDDDKNTMYSFLNDSILSPNRTDILNKQVAEILFLKSGNLFIDSSQLELDLTELDEYYVIIAKPVNEQKTLCSKQFNKANDNVRKVLKQNISKFYDSLDFNSTINNEINAFIKRKVAKVVGRYPFFVLTLSKHLSRDIDHAKLFCVEKRSTLNWIKSPLDYLCYIWREKNHNCNSNSFTKYLFLSPVKIEKLKPSQLDIDAYSAYIVFGKASADKLANKINESENAKVIDDLNYYESKYSDNIPTEEEFLNNMRSLYQELKKSAQIQSTFYRKFADNTKLRFQELFEKDIEVI